jgi:hypothetical protein
LKKLIIKYFISALLFGCITSLTSCKKNNNSDTKPPSDFTWTFTGSTYKANLDSAYVHYDLTPYLIIAITGTNFYTSFNRKIYFSLTSFNPGNFNIVPGPGSNILQYVDELGFDHSGVSGTLIISSNSNNLLSGNFTAIIAGPSGNNPISGTFTNVPIKP